MNKTLENLQGQCYF